MSLSARTVFITGASRGLGLQFVKQILMLPSPPEMLFAACRDPVSAKNLQAIADTNASVKIIKLDVEKDEDIDAAVRETKSLLGERGLNLLINNAGINEKSDGGTLLTQTRERMQNHFNVNATAPLMLAQKFLPLLQQAASKKDSALSNNQAGIVMVSSTMASQGLAKQSGFTNAIHYRSSKSALDMVTVLISTELAKDGILVMALHPGWVKTDMGGVHANLTLEESITGCLDVIGKADSEILGKLVDWEGNVLPY